MESTGQAANRQSMISSIEYANVCQSLHIGLCNYQELNSNCYRNVNESYNDVKKYQDFFRNNLCYDRVLSITD
jgi:hypothetical protein